MTNLRYLYRKQESTGIFICEHGPFHVEDVVAARMEQERLGFDCVIGIGVSADGREVITGPVVGHELSLRGDKPDARTIPGARYIPPLEERLTLALDIAVREIEGAEHKWWCKECGPCSVCIWKSEVLARIARAKETGV